VRNSRHGDRGPLERVSPDNRLLSKLLLARFALVLVLITAFVGCSPDAGDIDATPDCPRGTRGASSITVNANLSAIRPFGSLVILRVRGNRTSTDECFQSGARSSFLERIEGTGTMMRNVPNLADLSWTINVTALSGGDQVPVELPVVLTAGGTHTLTVSGNSSGRLTASF